jgi:hypothetical protein
VKYLALAKSLRLCGCYAFTMTPTTSCEVCVAVAALLRREVAAALREAAETAKNYHPARGQCCWENPEGHWGSVSTCDGIAENLRARAEEVSNEGA